MKKKDYKQLLDWLQGQKQDAPEPEKMQKLLIEFQDSDENTLTDFLIKKVQK